ncbi:VWA domain-containing protein [Microbacteriaceae bacterium VKM Ac-2855]|nr:VWA domain-containing protein [Microbacteriaceae bacterium VKM Ac-2855]
MAAMNALRRTLSATAVLFVAIGAAIALPAVASAAEGDTALGGFGACIAGGGSADVLLLVDESSSLLTSDPELGRVTSATYFVNQLADFATDVGTPVDVQLSVFGDGYETILPWTGLSADSLGSVRSGIAGLAERVDGFDTDYWTALDGARTDLAARAAARTTETSCQAIVWLTDGKLDYFPRESEAERAAYGTEKRFAPGVQLTSAAAATQIRDAASSDLCRSGGLADQLRSSKITLFGVGLNGSGSTPTDFDFIRSVATGADTAGSRCGDLTEPVPGSFYLADNIDALLFAFDELSSPGTNPIAQEAGICQVVVCADEAHNFVLDASTPRVRLLASADVDGLTASIVLPTGERVDLTRGAVGDTATAGVAGATVDYTWITDNTISVIVDKAAATDAAWSGPWSFAFTDPLGSSDGRRSQSNLHITGALKPSWSNADGVVLHTGEDVEGAVFSLIGRDAAAVDPSAVLGTLRYTVTRQDAKGQESTVLDTTDKAAIGAPVSIPLANAAVGQGLLTLRLEVTTATATSATGVAIPGTALDPSIVAQRISIEAPASYPTVAERLDFGQIEGPADASTLLAMTGEGCAWLPEDAVKVLASPEGLGSVRASSPNDGPESCASADAEGLPVQLTTDAGGNGSINGTVRVMLTSSDGSGEPLEIEVPFTASLALPLDAGVTWLTFALTLFAGIAVPVGVLYFAKWLVSVIPARPLVAATVPIEVSGSSVIRGGSRFAIGAEDLRTVVALGASGSRTANVGDATLRARVSASPTEAGFVSVQRPGFSGASGDRLSTDAKGTTARLPLAVHNNWVVFHRPGDPATSAEILLLIGGDASAAQRTALADDVNARLTDVLARLVAAEPVSDVPVTPEGPGSPFGSTAQQAGGFGGFGAATATATPTVVRSPAPNRSADPPASPPETSDGDPTPPRGSSPWDSF